MSADGSMFVSPTGKTPEHLYNTVRVLIDTLNRVSKTWGGGSGGDLTEIEQELSALQNEVQEILDQLASWASGMTPQQAFELSLVTAVDTILGSVSNLVLETYKQSQKAAEATIRSLVEGQANTASIRVIQSVQKSDREAVASQLESFQAQIGGALAAIEAETIARSDGDNALAQVDQTITTALNGNIAQVQIIAQSVDGIEQKFAVTLNSNGQVTGLVQLDGTPQGTAFTVVADKFMIAQPDKTGGAPVPVFAIGTVGSSTKLGLRGDMIINGSITANKINASALSAITANLGTVSAGRIRDPDDTVRFDLPNMRIYRVDGKARIDLLNRRILFLGD